MSVTVDLFNAAKSGDNTAFNSLVELQRSKLQAFCLSRISGDLRTFVDVEDVLQETSLRAFQCIERVQWQGERALLSWFCGIAQNVIHMQARRAVRIRTRAEEVRPEGTDDSSPSRQARREERFDRLESSLTQLTDEQQQVVRMTRIEGLSVREAAVQIGRSEKATYQLLWRALKKLREVFGETGSLRLPADRNLGQGNQHVR